IVALASDVRASHIVTVEDPIEYVHPHRRSQVEQLERGFGFQTPEQAVKRVLDLGADAVAWDLPRHEPAAIAELCRANVAVWITLQAGDATDACAQLAHEARRVAGHVHLTWDQASGAKRVLRAAPLDLAQDGANV